MRSKYKAKAAAADQRRQATSDAIASVTSGGKRSRITDYLETDAAAGKRDAHEALALMFAALRIPEHHADHPLFINVVAAIAHAGVGYVPLRGGSSAGRACGSAARTSTRGWLDGAVFNDSTDCRMETKTGGYVASILRPVVEEVGPQNVVAFCTDGGSNLVACQELMVEWPHFQHVPCAAHVMDLLMEDVGKMGWAKKVVDRGGEIISFVRNHHWTRGYLRNPAFVGPTVLHALKPAGTRFGTQYIAVSHLCELRQSLAQMVVSDLWKGWAVGVWKAAAESFTALVLDAAWWRSAEFFCKLLKLPFMAMRLTDSAACGESLYNGSELDYGGWHEQE
ncbi:unnamed protein product [Closterium sp. NIES-54]